MTSRPRLLGFFEGAVGRTSPVWAGRSRSLQRSIQNSRTAENCESTDRILLNY